jgi:hypothetical protein
MPPFTNEAVISLFKDIKYSYLNKKNQRYSLHTS